MGNSTNRSLLAILCKDSWVRDISAQLDIRFYENGQGHVSLILITLYGTSLKFSKLLCRSEFVWWICTTFDWRILDDLRSSSSGSTIVEHGATIRFDLEIALSKRTPEWWAWPQTNTNEYFLKDTACLPKRYMVTLENGDFIYPTLRAMRSSSSSDPRCDYRITFDKSPIPPAEEWKNLDVGPRQAKFWDLREFCCNQKPKPSIEDTEAYKRQFVELRSLVQNMQESD